MNREFEEIVVEYPPKDLCTYPEYKGKPYFSIKYKEGNNHFIGYGTYKPKVFSRFLRDYFMPSIRPKGKWINKSQKSGCGITFVASECTCCGKKTLFNCDELIYKYCPNCGAEMEGE